MSAWPSLWLRHSSPHLASLPFRAMLLWNAGLTHLAGVHSTIYVLAGKWCLLRWCRDCEKEPVSELSWKANLQLLPFQSSRCFLPGESHLYIYIFNILLFPPLWPSYPTLKLLAQRRPDIPIYVGDTERPVFWNLDQSGVRLTNINVVPFGLWQQVRDLFYDAFWGDV